MTNRFARVATTVALAVIGSAGVAAAFDRSILGNRLDVLDMTGLEPKRKITVFGKESPSDIGIFSDPTSGGATLTVIANGGTSTSDTYVLDASGWSVSASALRYRGPTGGDGDPVRSVVLSRSPSGAVKLRAMIKGSIGIQDVDVVPPNPGSDGGLILDVVGGDRYCVAFGAGAGGTESRDSAIEWRILGAAAQPGCPSTTTTITSSTTTTTLDTTGLLCPNDPTRTFFAGGPGTGACHLFDDNQPDCERAFHIGGECGAASCYFDFQNGSCNGCGPNNESSGRCVNTCIHGAPSCPGDPTRTIFAGYSGSAACRNLDYRQELCEKAYHIDGVGQPASCYYDTGSCLGCGPNNLDAGECQNTCPVCEGDPSRTMFAGGPSTSPCHKFDGAQDSCEGAFVMSGDTRAYTSCYYDAGLNECRGCSPQNQSNQECINSCPVCPDPARQIFVGGPGSSACHLFDNSPSLCQQSYHMSGSCNELASCYYDYDNTSCNGCGPFNQQSGACSNVCSGPICGNGIVDLEGEQCDGPAVACGLDQLCNAECQCIPCGSSVIPAGGGQFSGSTSGNSSLSGGCGSGTDSAPEQVYQWTPATSGQATITACGGTTNYDTVIYLRQGSCNGTEVDCDDDSDCGLPSTIFPTVSAGTTYYVVVDGYGGQSGNFTLTVVPASASGAFLD